MEKENLWRQKDHARIRGEGGLNPHSRENSKGSENTLCDTIMVDTFVQTRRMYNTKSELLIRTVNFKDYDISV